ncbi:hypothetical protein [Roseovarius mucosus]|uniref:hypothetical protein n=1 Tax=Roseovarius mucosus TaxID=215743 RepID=UPI0011AED1EA|nr:hypothetical protein [Roseovarius mucosus]
MLTLRIALCLSILIISGCATPQPNTRAVAINEVAARNIEFENYPEAGNTYLSFSSAHGFQVNYIARNGNAWLWYPGNRAALKEEWMLDPQRNAICWRHPENSYNPVTKSRGGAFACSDLRFARKTIVSQLSGDAFNLSSGRIPYVGEKCSAPREFAFDHERFSC